MKFLIPILMLFCFFIASQNVQSQDINMNLSCTTLSCGFSVKNSAGDTLLRQAGNGYLRLKTSSSAIDNFFSIDRGAQNLLSVGYYQPQSLYYFDIPSPVKVTANFLGVHEIHAWNGDTIILDPNTMTRVRSGIIVDGYTRINNSGCYTGTWSSCSDLRLKKNIRTIDNALSKILSLKGITFQWRKDEIPGYNFEEGTNIGFAAQEVEKVLPELVRTENDGFKSVAYSNMIPVLVEAIKEQQEIINEQRIMIEQQKDILRKQGEKLDEVISAISGLKEKNGN